MKVSIIICAYNEERFIARAIRSALEQNFPQDDFEVIVVDDGSRDGTVHTAETLASFFSDKRIRVIKHEKNMGLSAAKNTGLRAALGVYATFLDANDWLTKNAILIQYEFLVNNKKHSFVWPDYIFVDEKGDFIKKSSGREGSGVMFSKTDLDEVGLFDESLRVWEERDMYRRLESAGKTGIHISFPLYKYTQAPGSLSKRGMSEKETGKAVYRAIKKANEERPADANK